MTFVHVKNLVAGLFLFLFVPVVSANPDFRFTHINTNQGLSQSNVTCIVQDHKGFMWFGSFNGLNRYDGYDFKVYHYHRDDSTSLSHNYISALCEDRDGRLWVGTSDGLNRYDFRTDGFQSYKHQDDDPGSISDNQIETILQDRQGRLWIGTRNGGLELFNPEDDSFIHYSPAENNLSSHFVRVLYEDSDGTIWVAHENGAIDLLAENSHAFEPFSLHGKKLTDSRITAIVESRDRTIWIGTQGDGLYRIDHEPDGTVTGTHYLQSERENSISSNIILSLMIDRQNTLWMGTENSGISILDLETNTFQQVKHDPFDQASLNHNSIWSIYEDRAGSIWIGTYAYGINFLPGRTPNFHHTKHYPGCSNCLNHNMVNAFVEDRDKNLWIATDGGGLDYLDRQTNRFYHYNRQNSTLGTDVIVSLFEYEQDRLWIGTWSDGLYQFDQKSKRFIRYSKEQDGLASNRILNIIRDQRGGLWLCTFWGGLTYFDTDNQTTVVYSKDNSGLSDDDVRVVMQDIDGNLWIGTDVGVDVFDPETKIFTPYRHDEQRENSLSKGFVHSILQSRDSTIWIGTAGGLNRFDRTQDAFVHYSTADGLPDNEIKYIIEDDDHFLWLSTDKGISRFDPRSLTFKNYDVSDGLQGNEFNARSGIKTADGEILFGGNNGFNRFHPDDIRDNPYIPPVVLTDFRIFNRNVPIGVEHSPLQQHISETRELKLSWRDAAFSFEFAALNFISPEKNQYAYMMEGFETDWNLTDSRTATYTNLDPGDYVFRVKAANNDGIWNEEGVSVNITIDPPFWKTWWAYTIGALLTMGIIAFVLQFIVSRQRLKTALAMENLQLDKMYELDQIKSRLFANIAHEFHSPLTLIKSPLERLITDVQTNPKLKNSLKRIHGNTQRLQRMIGQLKDIQKFETGDLQLSLAKGNIVRFIERIVRSFQDYADDHGIQYQFKTAKDSAIVWFDQDKLDKIVYNLLSNAFKFTPHGGEIMVSLSILSSDALTGSRARPHKATEYAQITVQDNGIGIPADKVDHIFQRYFHIEDYDGHHYEGSGIGLALVNELVQLYGGEISAHSTEGQGTTFGVQIPIDEQYLEENQLVGEFNVLPAVGSTRDSTAPDSEEFDALDRNEQKVPVKDIPIILVVEDDKEIRNYIKDTLESRYRVISAENGQEGFKKAVRIIPDLVISDIKMPVASGTLLCKMLREDEKTWHIPIILLTAFTENEYRIEGLSRGADAYLTKPFNMDVLEAQISNLLESRKKMRIKFSRKIHLEPHNVDVEDMDETFLQLVMETIEKHMSDTTLNADFLSKKVGMSRMQLYRKLRALTNQTVHEFIRSIRLKRAVQLLEQKRMTITEVAYEVGFNDLTYFARCFRKQYHKSPSEYISK